MSSRRPVTGGLDRAERVRPQRPLVEAWFSSPEGYYSLADSPANATCQVRCGAAAAAQTVQQARRLTSAVQPSLKACRLRACPLPHSH